MGGVAVSLLSVRNAISQGPNQDLLKARTGGFQSVEIGNDSPTESRIRRSPSMKDVTLAGMNEQFYGGKYVSTPNLLKQSVDKFRDRPAMAFRPIAKIEKLITQDGAVSRPFEVVHLKPTVYLTYTEMWEKMVNFGKGLRELGFNRGDRVGLYEDTRMEWMVSAYGLWTQSLTGVTVYANLGEDALEYAIQEAEVQVMVCNGKSVATVVRLCKKRSLPVPMLIYTDTLPQGTVVEGNNMVYSWNDVVAKGAASNLPVDLPKSPEETALIMYTSGTTGDPKGVVISHGNVVACVLGFSRRMEPFLGGPVPAPGEAYVAFLPLAHILEFAAENVLLLRGSMVGYGSSRTLTNAAAHPHGDLEEYRPSVFVGVPRIFDTIKKAVESKLPRGGLKRKIFDRAYLERRDALHRSLATPYWDSKVFAAPRALLGGRVRAIISGGAPMSASTQEFMTVVFGCSVGQGYGLTETCAAGTIQQYCDLTSENIGGLLSNCEMKLKDVDNFKHTDALPRGEILLRGPVITKGYYKQPQKTAEAFLADGWFATGDVGQIQPNGSLKIVGRVKALAKNAFGEYVALDALESVYVMNDLCVPNGVCVLVDSHKAYICALVLTDEQKAMNFAKKAGVEGAWPEILKNPQFHAKAAESLAATAKGAGKKPFELVKYVRVLSDEWTPENGVLTAAMKLKRRVVDEKYATVICELFLPGDGAAPTNSTNPSKL